MSHHRQHLREALIATAALTLGWWAHTRPVQAAAAPAPATDLQFQLNPIGPQTALSIYSPADHTISVYTAATAGNSQLACTYQFHLTRPGGPIERKNCQPGSLLP